jgi:membrane protein DedA with SNARE-associated domain
VEHVLAGLLDKFTYLAIFTVLSVAGLGVPISEDLTLLLGGGLASRGITRFLPTLAVGYLGVLFGDALIHQWGQRMGPRAYAAPLVQKALSAERQQKLREHFAKHAFLTVVVGRHTPFLRAPIFFLSGASGMKLLPFLIADALSAAVTVPVVVTLGYYFGQHLDVVRARMHQVQWVVGGAVAIGVGLWLWRRARRKLHG